MRFLFKFFHEGHEHNGGNASDPQHQHEGEACCDDCFVYINGTRFNVNEGLTITIGNTQLQFKHSHPEDNVTTETRDYNGYTIKIQTMDSKYAHHEDYPQLFINEEPIHFTFNPQTQTYTHHAFFKEFRTLEELAHFYIGQFPQIKIHNH